MKDNIPIEELAIARDKVRTLLDEHHARRRIPFAELTSDQLDQLYAQLEAARYDVERLTAREGRYRSRTVTAEGRAEEAERLLGEVRVECATAILRAERAEAAIERARALHQPNSQGNCANRCYTSGLAPARYPCPTIRALDEQQEQQAAAEEQPLRDKDGTSICTCTYGHRCPACRD
ncbi:hypothetical protein ACF09L_32770 [Streptomyces sp. NPDC014779]|uniref:hypothetical protein n=1 Tax=Streptomyces sp. NPDC014779 TaxID=3364911 RepID=UPI0036F6566B